MKMKKILILLLVLAMAAGLCSCGETQQEAEPDTPSGNTEKPPEYGSLTLPVAHNDTIDPFKAESEINRALIPLLYDSLVYIDESFQPVELLAQSCTVSGKTLSVALRSVSFNDGSAITAADVVYSYEQAKKCKYYSEKLSNFSKAEISGNDVLFTLKSDDIFAAACLDFPIVKSGTVAIQYKGMKLYEIVPPIGTGRYTLQGTLPNASLVANPSGARGTAMNLPVINLFEVTNSEGMAYGLQIGNYDVWYNSLSSGKYSRVNASQYVVPTNNFVYLAFNSDKSIFQQVEVRRAVSMLLDREKISAISFQGHATPAVTPFNPAWSTAENIAVNTTLSAQQEQALQLLESVGYTNINTYGYRCSNTKSLNCTLTVCKGNGFKTAAAQQIKELLAAVNFNVTIVELEYDAYMQAIENGEFEMYLGEIKLCANMDFSAFFNTSGAANCVMVSELDDSNAQINVTCDAYKKFRAGEYSLSDFCLLFDNEMPFVPLCYRTASMFYSRDFKSEINPTCYDNFYDISSWQIKPQSEDK